MQTVFYLLLAALSLCACSTTKIAGGPPAGIKLEVPEIDGTLTDPKVKVFHFMEETVAAPYICLTKTELEKLLYDLQAIKQSRLQDKVKVDGQAKYCRDIIGKLNN
jgi:hypothetical protein